MKLINMLLLSLGVVFLMSPPAKSKEWRGIIPLQSTRADVERLLGLPTDPGKLHASMHDLQNEVVFIIYASGPPCGRDMPSGWQVPRGTVVSITVSPKSRLRFSDLMLDERRYKKTPGLHNPDVITYTDDEEGESVEVHQGNVMSFRYFPAAKDKHLSCPETRGTPEQRVISSPMFDSYGDINFDDEKSRLDNLAAHLLENLKMNAYIIAYAGPRARAGEAGERAERAKNYLVRERGIAAERIFAVDGGGRKESMVELYLVLPGAPVPQATPSVNREEQILKASKARNGRRPARPRRKG